MFRRVLLTAAMVGAALFSVAALPAQASADWSDEVVASDYLACG
jgi:hypothetical protein